MQAILEKDRDTICALSTPHGQGGISVIRVSGKQASEISRKLCRKLPDQLESHRVYFTKLLEFDSNQEIDDVLMSYFTEGKSFTGEETIEVSCHGSQYLSQKIVNELIKAGCRHADKGEFTYRAFMNNKLDLIQAESVLNLIESQSTRTANQAFRQLQGELSKEINLVEEDILLVGAHLEAQIDFVEQDIEPEEEEALLSKISNTTSRVKELVDSFNKGRLLKEGLQVIFIGEPNVGKSSLLNAMLSEEKAIVTNIAGTTRDVVSGTKLIDGVEVRFFDTAGIRKADNVIEQMGIEKTYNTLEGADMVFFILDASDFRLPEFDESLLENKDLYFIINKTDCISNENEFNKQKCQLFTELCKKLKYDYNNSFVMVSAKEEEGLNRITNLISNYLANDLNENSISVVSSRQYECLRECEQSLMATKELLKLKESPEFVAFEIKNALLAVHRLLGKEFDDQIMDKVFSEFCLGK